jgi:hypothetical protein
MFSNIWDKKLCRYCHPLQYISVGDPDPNPQDPHGFGPTGSGSISQRYESGIRLRTSDPESGSGPRILPFSHKCVDRTEIMLAKLNFYTNFSTKLNFKTEGLGVSFKNENMEKIFFCIL